MSRIGRISRETTETAIAVVLDLEGPGEIGLTVATDVPFFDHMLSALAKHGRFGLELLARGDLAVDPHHTVEDVGIALGEAFRAAAGDGRGIARFASIHAPMDDALVLAALDVSGRPYLHYGLSVEGVMVGSFPADLAREFFHAFTVHAALTLHLIQVQGRDAHHILEAAFKGTGLVLHQATRIVGQDIPSTKGVL